jgi:hypothetical protein
MRNGANVKERGDRNGLGNGLGGFRSAEEVPLAGLERGRSQHARTLVLAGKVGLPIFQVIERRISHML